MKHSFSYFCTLDICFHLNVRGGDIYSDLCVGHHARAHRQPGHHAL